MAWRSKCLVVVLAAEMFAPGRMRAQTGGLDALPATVDVALQQMSSRAGVIFAGQVAAVRRHEAGTRDAGVVEVEFRVDQAVRGCSAGTYVLREWAGLWEGGTERYRVGQRLLMLLHAPGPAGMSAPVHGMQGAIPIVASDAARVPSSVAWNGEPVEGAGPPPMSVDLRWVETGVYRVVEPEVLHRGATASLQMRAADDPRRLAVEAQSVENRSKSQPVRVVAGSGAEVRLQPAPLSEAQPGSDGRRSLASVLSMLGANGRDQHVAQ